MKPDIRFISFEKLVNCNEFFKHHYNREGGAGQEANKLQRSLPLFIKQIVMVWIFIGTTKMIKFSSRIAIRIEKITDRDNDKDKDMYRDNANDKD